MGIEPTSSAWKAEVIAIIRHPQGKYYYTKYLSTFKTLFYNCMKFIEIMHHKIIMKRLFFFFDSFF